MFKKHDPICEIILNTIKQAAAGDLEVRAIGFSRKSNYAQIAHALNDLLDQIEVWQREVSSSIDAAFAQRDRNIYENGLQGLFKSTAIKLKDANQGIKTSIKASKQNELALNLEEISTSAQMIEQVNECLERSKEDIAQTKDNSLQIASGAQRSSASIKALSQKSGELSELVSLSSELNSMLNSKAEEISNILNMVKDITDQTQLLSLNAAIEAARAGEHGRGFAVVADEVGKLAASTQQATNTISMNVASLKDSVSKCVEYGHKVQEISAQNQSLVSELSSALEEFGQLSNSGASSANASYELQNQLYLQISLLLYKTNIKESLLNPAVQLDEALANRIFIACKDEHKGEFSKIREMARQLAESSEDAQLQLAAELETRLLKMCMNL